MEIQIAKVLKTGSGKYAVYKIDPETGKGKNLAYQRWFNTRETAEKFKEQFIRKMLKQ